MRAAIDSKVSGRPLRHRNDGMLKNCIIPKRNCSWDPEKVAIPMSGTLQGVPHPVKIEVASNCWTIPSTNGSATYGRSQRM